VALVGVCVVVLLFDHAAWWVGDLLHDFDSIGDLDVVGFEDGDSFGDLFLDFDGGVDHDLDLNSCGDSHLLENVDLDRHIYVDDLVDRGFFLHFVGYFLNDGIGHLLFDGND